jgi:hypothetical protein
MIGACGGTADECTRIKDKVRPVLVKMLTGFASAGGKTAALLAHDRARVIAANATRGEVGFEIDGRAVPEPSRIDPLP